MKVISLVPKKKLKFKPITAIAPKYNLIDVKPIFDNTQDWDKDGVINRKDCMPLDPNKHGLLSSYWKRHKALKEAQDMSKLGYTPTEDVQDDINERLSRAETGIQHFKQQVGERGERMQENIQEGMKDTGKNIDRFAKEYVKRSESPKSDPRMQKPEVTRGVHYLIPASVACRKMYHDENTGEPSSIPKYKRDVYTAFSPKTVGSGGPFMPHRAPNPPWLQEKQRRRELIREYLRLKAIQDAQGVN